MKDKNHNNWSKFDKYLYALIVLITLTYVRLAVHAFNNDNNLNMFFIKLGIIATVAAVMVISLVIYQRERKVNPNFESGAYRFDRSLLELILFAFKKKKCPYCSQKLQLVKKKTYKGRGKIQYSSINEYGDIYKIHFGYKCVGCHKEIEIRDLGKRKEDIQ